jgi:hypothetical protein
MENVPIYVSVLFSITTGLGLIIFYHASHLSKLWLLLAFAWLTTLTILSVNNFFTVTNTLPPRFLLLITPPLLLIVSLFFTAAGQQYLDTLHLKYLTLLHIVRFPLELVLFFLFLHKTVPELMTFKGRNFDILSGLTAPIIYYFGFVRKKISNKTILVWNFVGLALLFIVVSHAILSAPSPFQRFAFTQPNIAVLYFPFVWLPGFIVPLVLFSHLVCIRRLLLINRKTIPNKVLPKVGSDDTLPG